MFEFFLTKNRLGIQDSHNT